MSLHLYIGNQRLSSWSMRPYLALHHAQLSFETTTLFLDTPSFAEQVRKISPTGRVPSLHHDGRVIWDSLAICEHVADLAPAAQLWPADLALRARARSLAAEMHSGFEALRKNMPFAILESRPGVGHTPEALADARRVQAIWREELAAHGGPYLMGSTFSLADAMFAPVASRFRTYAVPCDAACEQYIATIFALPGVQQWMREAQAEPV